MKQVFATGAQEALAILKEGNARFVCAKPDGPNRDKARRKETWEQGQHPFAILVSCSDSRVPPEIIFDVGFGDIFVVRVAGNVCGISEMGSIEHAVEHLHIPLIIVMGHSGCGIVSAVVNQLRFEGNQLAIAQRIAPAVKKVTEARPGLTGRDLIDECIRENVGRQIETLVKESPVVRKALNFENLLIVGAVYDVEHGDVNWMGKHPNEYMLLKAKSEFPKPFPRTGDSHIETDAS